MGAINLLSNGESENQKPSVYAGLRTLISTFCLFPLAPAGNILNSFAYEIWLRLFGLLSLFRRHGLSDFLLPFCCHNKLLHYTFRTRQTENLKCIRSNSCAVIIRFTLLKNGSLVSMGESFASIIAYTTSNSLD